MGVVFLHIHFVALSLLLDRRPAFPMFSHPARPFLLAACWHTLDPEWTENRLVRVQCELEKLEYLAVYGVDAQCLVVFYDRRV